MTVKELIEELSKEDPDAKVYLDDWSEGYVPPQECNIIRERGPKSIILSVE